MDQLWSIVIFASGAALILGLGLYYGERWTQWHSSAESCDVGTR